MKIEKWMWTMILSLVILVAAFNILSTLIMVAMEKRRDIGILKAMGARDRDIARIFSTQGLIVGIVGSGARHAARLSRLPRPAPLQVGGAALGYLFPRSAPVKMQPFDFVLVIVIAMLLSYLGAVYPARRARRLVPVDAIREG